MRITLVIKSQSQENLQKVVEGRRSIKDTG
jgi:hypothetical protein